MRGVLLTFLLWIGALVVLPAPGWAEDSSVDAADREIIERLTRMETRLDGLDTGLVRVETRLDEGLKRLDDGIRQLREDMNKQNEQLHDRLGNFMLLFTGVISVIGVILATLIGVGNRDRKATPSTSQAERDSLENIRAALHALAQRDENVAAVLKQFNL